MYIDIDNQSRVVCCLERYRKRKKRRTTVKATPALQLAISKCTSSHARA